MLLQALFVFYPRNGQNRVDRTRNMPSYEKLLQTLEGFIMKKFLVVTLVGMVLAMDIYGFVNQFMKDEVEEIDHIKETTVTVYAE